MISSWDSVKRASSVRVSSKVGRSLGTWGVRGREVIIPRDPWKVRDRTCQRIGVFIVQSDNVHFLEVSHELLRLKLSKRGNIWRACEVGD